MGGGGRATNVHCPELVLPVRAGNVRGIGSPSSASLTNSLHSYLLLRKLISISYLPRGGVKCARVFPESGQGSGYSLILILSGKIQIMYTYLDFWDLALTGAQYVS